MTVEVAPFVYIQQPDYQGIKVVGRRSGIGLPAETPYSITIDVAHLRGTEGVTVIGAGRSQRIPVRGG